jgi:hypothetical protein
VPDQPPTTRAGDAVSSRQGDWTPRPDPTVLTTAALEREIGHIKSLLDRDVQALEDVMGEKFTAVDKQLTLVEQQRVEQKQDTKTAVDAALLAQKEAVREQTIASERSIAKSETATNQQLQQLGQTFTTAFEGLRRDIDDTKQRLTVVEATKAGGQQASVGIYAFAGFILVLLTIGAIVAAKV